MKGMTYGFTVACGDDSAKLVVRLKINVIKDLQKKGENGSNEHAIEVSDRREAHTSSLLCWSTFQPCFVLCGVQSLKTSAEGACNGQARLLLRAVICVPMCTTCITCIASVQDLNKIDQRERRLEKKNFEGRYTIHPTDSGP